MAYTKTVWQTGDVITADKLNNMEGGIESASPLYVDLTYDSGEGVYTPSVEFAVAEAAFLAGTPVYVRYLTDEIGARAFVAKMTELVNGDGDRVMDQMFGGEYHIITAGDPPTYVINGYAIGWTALSFSVTRVTF